MVLQNRIQDPRVRFVKKRVLKSPEAGNMAPKPPVKEILLDETVAPRRYDVDQCALLAKRVKEWLRPGGGSRWNALHDLGIVRMEETIFDIGQNPPDEFPKRLAPMLQNQSLVEGLAEILRRFNKGSKSPFPGGHQRIIEVKDDGSSEHKLVHFT